MVIFRKEPTMKTQLKRLRKTAGIKSQKEMAARLGVLERTYASWERGEVSMSFPQAIDCANILECSLDDLAGRDWPESPPMSADERDLVGDYRACTPRERQAIRNMASTMADDGNAKNVDDRGVEEAG